MCGMLRLGIVHFCHVRVKYADVNILLFCADIGCLLAEIFCKAFLFECVIQMCNTYT